MNPFFPNWARLSFRRNLHNSKRTHCTAVRRPVRCASAALLTSPSTSDRRMQRGGSPEPSPLLARGSRGGGFHPSKIRWGNEKRHVAARLDASRHTPHLKRARPGLGLGGRSGQSPFDASPMRTPPEGVQWRSTHPPRCAAAYLSFGSRPAGRLGSGTR